MLAPSGDQARLAGQHGPNRSAPFLNHAFHAAGSSVVLAVRGAPPGMRLSHPETTSTTWKPTYGLVAPISSRVKATRLPSGAQAELIGWQQNTLVGQCQSVLLLPPATVT